MSTDSRGIGVPALLKNSFWVVLFGFCSCFKDDSSDDDLVGNWKRGYEFEGVGRTEAVVFQIGESVFIGGGYDGDDRLVDFWRYESATGAWVRVADFPGTPRTSAVAFQIGGKGYMGTGYDEDGNYLKDFWEYDPTGDKWTRKRDFAGTARYEAVGFAIEGRGFLCSGYDGNYLKDLWEYSPGTDSWVQKASLGGSKRSGASVFVQNGKAYVLTGLNNGSYVTDFWFYEPATNTWTELERINDATDEDFDDDYGENIRRANAITFIQNGKGYLLGGSRSGVIGSVWEYNFGTDRWIEKTPFEGSPREGGIGFIQANGTKGFVTTGANSSFRFDDVWEFQPLADQDDDDN